MKRYHINETNGETGTGVATSTLLSNIINLKELNKMIVEGMVNVRSHPEDESLKILNYSKLAQNKSEWNNVTKQARGLIVRATAEDYSDAIIIERPWRKFFTLEQLESGWNLGDEENSSTQHDDLNMIDFKAPAEVSDKLDGSMGILYLSPDGEPAIATRGSFEGDIANYYTKLLRSNNKMLESARIMLKKHKDNTFIFELIGKDNRIVVSYDNNDISFIGAVEKHSGIYKSTKDFSETWGNNGLTVSETMPVKTLEDAYNLPDRDNREGLVVRIISDNPESQVMVKIKQEDYKALHRIVTNFSAKQVRDVYYNASLNFGDFIKIAETGDVTIVPGVKEVLDMLNDDVLLDLKQEVKEVFEKSLLPYANKVKEVKKEIDSLPVSEFVGEDKTVYKNFALKIKDISNNDKSLYFKIFKARKTGQAFNELSATSELGTIAKSVKSFKNRFDNS